MRYEDINDEIELGLDREWIITNGIGGYAATSLIGVNTRRYHGLLVASMDIPGRRTLILSKLDESLEIDGKKYPFYSNMASNYMTEGFQYLVDFRKDYVPVYTFNVHNVIIKKYICMKYGENTTCVYYRIKNDNTNKATLKLTPIINNRDFHSIDNDGPFIFEQKRINGKMTKIIAYEKNETPIYIYCSEGKYHKAKEYDNLFRDMYYKIEKERGFDYEETHMIPGTYEINIDGNSEKEITFVCSLNENIEEINGFDLINTEIARLSNVIANSQINLDEIAKNNSKKADLISKLLIAADNFIVERKNRNLHSIIAGYPWFLDWSRDSMISFEGLLLVTKRFEIAKELLKLFVSDIHCGLVPNGYNEYDNFPVYNSVDSSLLLFEVVNKYLKYTNDYDYILKEIYPALIEIIRAYQGYIDVEGNNIYMDKEDFLISAGTSETQITWMDAKIDGKAITPREGKAVEINSLWYNALVTIANLSHKAENYDLENEFSKLSKKVWESFNKYFYNEYDRYLYDVFGDDKIRPNALFAMSVTYPVIDINSHISEEIIAKVEKELKVLVGLRTLSPKSLGYVSKYYGTPLQRDSSYHQGITWPWLLGLYYDALNNILKYGTDDTLKQKIEEKKKEFIEGTINTFYEEINNKSSICTISEIYDSEEPYKSRGAFAQAWSVGEVLRIITES